MLNIVIPMAGEGTRFKERGYSFPKPLIEVNNKAMIHVVVENVTPRCDHQFIFICRKEHFEKYTLKYLLNLIAPNCRVITLDQPTEGAACTVLLASEYFNNDNELLIVNSDQYTESNIDKFLEDARERRLDGSILTFQSSHPKWSYAKLDEEGLIMEVAEKKVISSHATVGIYYYRQGSMFFEAASQMIRKNVRVNNEFYVCPVYNEMILAGKRIGIYEIESQRMHGLGTPEDLEKFEKSEAFKNL